MGVSLSGTPGLTVLEMTHGGKDGPVRAMFIMGENPLLSDPVQEKVRETLTNLEFLAVTDIFLTDTAELADVVFPAASFAEKTGTFTNSERRVQMVRRVIRPLGQSKTDADIIMELSRRLDYPMDYQSSAEVMEEIAMLAPVYGGMYHDRLEESWGLQWPCWDREHDGTPFLHKYYFTRGRGRFVPASYQAPAELPDEDYPYLLSTGRVYHQYHTGTMSRKSTLLSREAGEALLQINPLDAGRLSVRNGDFLKMRSRRGEIKLRAELTDQVREGEVYTTFHFSEAPINLLTIAAQDGKSKCPEYKICAVSLEKKD